jgi:hypothetical protein
VTEDTQVFPDVGPLVDAATEDLGVPDVQEEDVVEIAMPNCVEEVINPIQVGTRVFYTCVSVGEGAAYQQIRTVKKSAKAIQVAAEVAPPERVGQVLKVSGDFLYFDTLLLDGGQVTERNIYRVPVDGGEVENVLTWTADDAGALDQPLFSSSSLVMVFAPQPGDDRLAFVLGDLTTQTGSGHLYIYQGGEQAFVSEGAVSAFGWGFGGTSLVWVAGGSLMIAGVDGSGANSVDPAVFTTGIPPQFLNGSTLVYAGTKKTLRTYTIGVGKEEVPVVFADNIQHLSVLDEDRVFILSDEMSVVDLAEGTQTSLGPSESFAIRHPIAISPDRAQALVGGSLDNPFKSFSFRIIDLESGSNLPAITTDTGVGVVTTAVAWQ